MGFIGKWGIDGGKMPVESFDYFRGFQGQGQYFPDGGSKHLTEIMAGQMTEFLTASSKDQPFCLSVSFKAPHVQDEHPEQFLPDPVDASLYRDVTIPAPETEDPKYVASLPISVQRSEGRRRWAVRFSTPDLYQRSVKNYYRLITGVDRAVGQALAALERAGVDDNTVVIYTSDNGFYLAEHGLAGKWFMHEESIRVPMIVYDPRLNRRAGSRISKMTLNIDLAPTMLALAGADVPASMQGRNVGPLLRGENTRWRSDWFYEHHFRHNGWIPATEGIRTDHWKYTRYIDDDPAFEELFDLQHDPHETAAVGLWSLSAGPPMNIGRLTIFASDLPARPLAQLGQLDAGLLLGSVTHQFADLQNGWIGDEVEDRVSLPPPADDTGIEQVL
jgi:arylsulfatase A-like enzyme